MSSPPSSRHRSVPTPESISKIGRGYPDKLVIFQLPASPFWWVRYYTQGRILKKSSKTTDKREALAFAKKFYEDILLRERNLLPLGSGTSFERCARELLAEQDDLVARGERNPKFNLNDKQKLEADILTFFKKFDVKEISYKHLLSFVATLAARDLKPSSLKQHLVLVNKVLAFAQREGVVDKVPSMPKIKSLDSPRGWFSEAEYEKLRKTAKKLADHKVLVRYHPITDELRLLITFMVNTFLRPSDIRRSDTDTLKLSTSPRRASNICAFRPSNQRRSTHQLSRRRLR